MTGKKVVGLTKDVGWQFGIRRTVPVTIHQAWEFLLSKKGRDIWLGKVGEIDWQPGAAFKTREGVEGEIRVFKPLSHMRMSWKKKGWDHVSMLQPRVAKGIGRSVISFHHDKLANEKERIEMKRYWTTILDKIESELQPKSK